MLAERLADEIQVSGRVRRTKWLGASLVAFGFVAFLAGTPFAAVTGSAHPILPVLVGFACLAVGGTLLGITVLFPSEPRRSAPRPPASCPRCGAAPETVTASGVARCGRCRTVFVPQP